MSITVPNSGTFPHARTAAAGTISAAITPHATGNAIIAVLAATAFPSGADPTVTSVVDSVDGSLTQSLAGPHYNAGGAFYIIWFYILPSCSTTGSRTVTCTFGQNCYADIWLIEASGLTTGGGYDSAVAKEADSGATNGTSLTITSSSALSTPTNELAISLVTSLFNNASSTVDATTTGWTLDFSASESGGGVGGEGLAHQIYTAGGTITPTIKWDQSGSDLSYGYIVAYQGTSGGGTSVLPPALRIIRQAVNRASTY